MLLIVVVYQLVPLLLIWSSFMPTLFHLVGVEWTDPSWKSSATVTVGWIILEAPLLIFLCIGCFGKGSLGQSTVSHDVDSVRPHVVFGAQPRLLSLLRICACALLVVALYFVRVPRSGLPVGFIEHVVTFEEEEEQLRIDYLERIPTRPGFEQTRLSGSEVMRLVDDYVTREKTDLSGYRRPLVSLYSEDGRLHWSFQYWMDLNPAPPGGFFTLVIDDETKEISIHPGL